MRITWVAPNGVPDLNIPPGALIEVDTAKQPAVIVTTALPPNYGRLLALDMDGVIERTSFTLSPSDVAAQRHVRRARRVAGARDLRLTK